MVASEFNPYLRKGGRDMKTLRKMATALFAAIVVISVMCIPKKNVPSVIGDVRNLTCDAGPKWSLAQESSWNDDEPDGYFHWGTMSGSEEYAPFGKVVVTMDGKEIPTKFVLPPPPPPPPWRDNRELGGWNCKFLSPHTI